MPFLSRCLLIFIIGSLTKCSAYKKHDDLLELVMERLNKTVKYYENNYSQMNLDGVFGLRLIQGQTFHIKDQLSKLNPSLLDHPLIIQLETFGRLANLLARSSLKYLRRENPLYLKEVGWVVFNPWNFSSSEFHNIYLRDKVIFDKAAIRLNEKSVEQHSDSCISAITKQTDDCKVPWVCLQFITRNESSGYELTHQLLMTMILHMVNCSEKANKHLSMYHNGSSLLKIQRELCIKNFFEVSTILTRHNGVVPTYFKDLFLEELMVCPMLGYYQFLHKSWLVEILSWQGEIGCWAMPKAIDGNKLWDELKNVHRGRKLLYEKVLPDGCSSHLTAVATGALMQFLRYLILCELSDTCGIHLPEPNYLLFPHLLPYEPQYEFQASILSVACALFVFMLVVLIVKHFFGRRMLRTWMKIRYSIHHA